MESVQKHNILMEGRGPTLRAVILRLREGHCRPQTVFLKEAGAGAFSRDVLSSGFHVVMVSLWSTMVKAKC